MNLGVYWGQLWSRGEQKNGVCGRCSHAVKYIPTILAYTPLHTSNKGTSTAQPHVTDIYKISCNCKLLHLLKCYLITTVYACFGPCVRIGVIDLFIWRKRVFMRCRRWLHHAGTHSSP